MLNCFVPFSFENFTLIFVFHVYAHKTSWIGTWTKYRIELNNEQTKRNETVAFQQLSWF